MDELLKHFKLSESKQSIKEWYNGYNINKTNIYNIFSVINYLNNPKTGLMPYWYNSGSIDFIEKFIKQNKIRNKLAIVRKTIN